MMRVSYTDSSIFETDAEAIVNPVNCVGVSGAGLAKEFARRYPENDRLYRLACKEGRVLPGRGVITATGLDGPAYIVNFPTKRHWRDRSRLEDIEMGLRNLHRELLRRQIGSIALPALGAGLGGLSWHEVRELIEREFGEQMEIKVTVTLCGLESNASANNIVYNQEKEKRDDDNQHD